MDIRDVLLLDDLHLLLVLPMNRMNLLLTLKFQSARSHEPCNHICADIAVNLIGPLTLLNLH